MPATKRQLERTVELKQSLVEFATSGRFRREYRQAIQQRFGKHGQVEEAALIEFVDSFVLTHRLRAGGTVLDAYLDAHPEAPAEDRAILLGWRNPVLGIFRVERFSDDAVVLLNLIDELRYRVRSNFGRSGLRGLRPASYVLARILPLEDEWSISGNMSLYPPSARPKLVQIAMEHAMRHPEEAFRNPERLARAVEIQREQHELFMEFFGEDILFVSAGDAEARLQEFDRWIQRKRASAPGAGERQAATDDREVPLFKFPADTASDQAIGIVSDPIEGTMFFPDLATIDETFNDPALASQNKRRALVRALLVDTDFSPVILRRLAQRHPDTASEVIGKVFRRKDFDWDLDGEALMRELQPGYYASPRWPSVTVIGDEVSSLADEPQPHKLAWGRRRS